MSPQRKTKAFKAGRADALAGRPPDEKYPDDGFSYDEGYQDGLDAADPTPAAKGAGEPRSRSGRTKAKPAKKGAAKRRRTPTPVRTARRQITQPVTRSTASALTALGGGIAIAAAYNFLNNSDYVAGALGGAAKAIRWLEDPTKSIPYRSPS